MSEKILNFCNISGDSVKKYGGIKKYIATGDIIDNKIVSYTEVDYNNKPSRANQNAQMGDVLFAKMKDTKKVISIDEENANYIYSTGFYIIRPSENVLTDYLYWLFNSPKFNRDKDKYCKGATQKALNNDGLKKIEIKELPNIEEQKSIICKLNKISEVIERKKEQLVILDELIKSQFVEMFSDLEINNKKWKIVNILEVASIDTNMTKDFEKYAELPHIGIENIEKNTGKLINYISVAKSNLTSGKYIFDERHIIYSKIRPNLNKVATPDFKGLCSADSYPILTNEKCKKEYLVFVLRSDYFLNYILSYSSRTNIPKVNKEQLSGFDFPLPPIDLQNQFADIVKQIDKQKFESVIKAEKEIEKIQKNVFYKWGR